MIDLKKAKCDLAVFSIGAIGYGLIEILWRGRTHWSMLCAGGLSFLGLSKISNSLKNSSLLIKALAGCGFITTVEYIFGIIFNVILKRKVWDYSKMPLNIGGQVCALYSFFWLILSMLFIPMADRLRKQFER